MKYVIERQIFYDVTYMGNLETLNSQKQRLEWWLPETTGWGDGGMLVREETLLVISSKDLKHSGFR